MAGFFNRPAPTPAAAAAPAPAAAPMPTPEPPALDGDFHDETFGGIPGFVDNSEFVSPGAAGLLETVDVDMAGGVGASDAGSVATAGTPVDAAPAGTPVDDSALTVQDHVTHASRQTGPTPTTTRAPRLHLHTLVASATNATVKFCSGYSPPDALGGERGFFQQIPWMKYMHDELPFTICGLKWHAHECAQRNFVLRDGEVDVDSACANLNTPVKDGGSEPAYSQIQRYR